jgi:hypothetical protein
MRQGADRGLLKDRGKDLYETHACATRALIRTGALNQFRVIFEPCAGRGAISRVLKAGGWRVVSHDLIAYDDADPDIQTGIDFFKSCNTTYLHAIVTNPPYRQADDFIRHGLELKLPVIVLLRLMALEGANRTDILNHLHHVFIGIERLPKFQREGWKGKRLKTETAPFAWFVFLPWKRHSDSFTASRISWREEDKNGLDVGSGTAIAAASEATGGRGLLIEASPGERAAPRATPRGNGSY